MPVHAPQSAESAPGNILDRYILEEEIGRGGYGRVYRARHRVLGRSVALKVLLARRGLARFLREATTVARLEHPNIIQIHDCGVTNDGRAFLALELLEGETLNHRVRTQGALPVGEAVWIVCQVLGALDVAHRQGIIHRDLKHSNIFLSQKKSAVVVKLLDFGIAKIADAGKLTATGMLLGTPRFMAPEAVLGLDADHRVDLWSAAIVLRELLCGVPAYPGKAQDVLLQIAHGPPRSLRASHPHLPGILLDVLEIALARSPERRFSSAAAFKTALLQCTPQPVMHTTAHEFALGSLDADPDVEPTAEVHRPAPASPPFDEALTRTAETRVQSAPESASPAMRLAQPVSSPPASRVGLGKLIAAAMLGAFFGAVLIAGGAIWWMDAQDNSTFQPPNIQTPPPRTHAGVPPAQTVEPTPPGLPDLETPTPSDGSGQPPTAEFEVEPEAVSLMRPARRRPSANMHRNNMRPALSTRSMPTPHIRAPQIATPRSGHWLSCRPIQGVDSPTVRWILIDQLSRRRPNALDRRISFTLTVLADGRIELDAPRLSVVVQSQLLSAVNGLRVRRGQQGILRCTGE